MKVPVLGSICRPPLAPPSPAPALLLESQTMVWTVGWMETPLNPLLWEPPSCGNQGPVGPPPSLAGLLPFMLTTNIFFHCPALCLLPKILGWPHSICHKVVCTCNSNVVHCFPGSQLPRSCPLISIRCWRWCCVARYAAGAWVLQSHTCVTL